MEAPQLNSTSRTIIGKQVKQLRQNNQIPAVMYGHDQKSQSITLNVLEYEKVFNQAGTSTLVDLIIDNKKPIKVLLHEPQMHPIRLLPLHADLYVVKMTEKLETEIPLHFVGESEAVTVLDGTLSPQIDALTVECYPDKLVPTIEVDITVLKTFDDILRISDIKLPEGIEALHDPEEVVATITPPRTEEELAELEVAPTGEEADAEAVSALEVSEEKKEEEEAEGEAKAEE